MESPMRGWLLSKVPDWDDDMKCAARFKALTGQRADWEARFLFWRALIIDLARHLNLLVLDTHAGFKMSLSQDHVSDVSKLDSYMLHLYWTLEKLSAQMVALEKAYNGSKQSAIKALKQDRTTAKRLVQSMHTIAASKVKCTEFHGKIQGVLAFISQAEMTKQVSEALKVGASALKEHTIPLDDIEACLHELDEAISDQHEVAGVLGSATIEFDVDDLDSQLTDLQLEVFGEKNEAPLVVENLGCNDFQKLPEPPVASLDAVQHALKSISLA